VRGRGARKEAVEAVRRTASSRVVYPASHTKQTWPFNSTAEAQRSSRRLSVPMPPRHHVLTRTAALLLFLVMFPVLGMDEQGADRRPARQAHSRALRQNSPLTAVITQFFLRYGGVAGTPDIVEIQIKICFACGGIKPGESIWVELPGFTRQNVLGLSDAMFAKPISTEGPNADIFSSALWTNQTRQVLASLRLCVLFQVRSTTDILLCTQHPQVSLLEDSQKRW